MSAALYRARHPRRALQSDHQRRHAKDEAGNIIAALWAAFILALIAGSLFA